jgi:hypothetical protein
MTVVEIGQAAAGVAVVVVAVVAEMTVPTWFAPDSHPGLAHRQRHKWLFKPRLASHLSRV